MATTPLDTNVLFAAASAKDTYHEQAQEVVRGSDRGDISDGVVTNYIIVVLLNLIREKLGLDAANGMLNRLIEGTHFEIIHAPPADFNAAHPILRQYPGLSFIDATIVAYMERAGIEYLYSFDGDFDAVDEITQMETANNTSE